MSDQEKANTVKTYLQGKFPECDVWEEEYGGFRHNEWPNRHFHISCDRIAYNLVIESEVWGDTETRNIYTLLDHSNIKDQFNNGENGMFLRIQRSR